MKLIKCYIENFGNLSKKEIDLSKDLVMIEEDNGWGKTTLSTFIKAMLYGMKDSRKKLLIEKERLKYRPWNGGNYGGNLDIEIDGTKYRIERFFGNTEKEDEFNLINLETNKKESKYSGNIGEEIFKLDKDSFEKSIYIPQQQIRVEKSNSIITKLTNLDNMQDDMNRYENAVNQIDGKVKNIKKLVKENKEQIDITKEKLERSAEAEGNFEECKIKYTNLINEKEANGEQLTEKEQILKKYNELQIREEKKKAYNSILVDKDNINEKKKKIEEFFKEDIPNEQTIKEEQDKIQRYILIKKTKENVSVTEEEREKLNELNKIFKEGIPTDEELEKFNIKIIEYNKLKNKQESQELSEEDIKELENFKKRKFEELDENKIEQIINKIKEIEILQNDIKDKEREIEYKEKDLERIVMPVLRNNILVITAIIVTALVGVICINNILGIISLIAMVGLTIFQIVRAKKIKKEKEIVKQKRENEKSEINKMQEERTDIINKKSNYQKEINDFVNKHIQKVTDVPEQIMALRYEYARYNKLVKNSILEKENVENLNVQVNEKRAELKQYFDTFELEYKEFSEALSSIRKYKKSIEILKPKIEGYDQNCEKIKEIEPQIKMFIDKFDVEENLNYSEAIDTIKAKIAELENIKTDIKEIEKKLEEFEKENNIEELENMEEMAQTKEEIEVEILKLKREQERILHNLTSIEKELNAFESEAEEKSENELQLENLKQEKKELEKQKSILEKTKEIMSKAKEKLSILYVAGMNENLKKYIDIIVKNDDSSLKKLSINTDLEVNIEVDGKQKEVDYFSVGNKDLIGVCTRFALVDSIFKDEKPFIILDDPFVNLDKDKIDNAINLIKEISKRYQIIYFTCHESRSA